MPEIIINMFVFAFGAVIGSFLNVCIHRMPEEGYSLIKPSSHCPHCKKLIDWYDNIPLLSYIILLGKCRACKGKIRFRYFIVELLTALVFLFFYGYFGLNYDLFLYLLLMCGLIVSTFIDIQHRIIPDEISVGGLAAGFILVSLKGLSLSPLSYNFKYLVNSFFGIIAGGGVLYFTGALFDLVYFKLLKKPPIQGETESMGGGDVKLLAMIGAFLGWKIALLTFFIAPFFGVVVGIISIITKKDHTIPYGPFLSMAAVLCLFLGDKIITTLFLR